MWDFSKCDVLVIWIFVTRCRFILARFGFLQRSSSKDFFDKGGFTRPKFSNYGYSDLKKLGIPFKTKSYVNLTGKIGQK